jgi:hypothetical protein
MAFFCSHTKENGDRRFSGSIGDHAIVACLVAAVVVVLALAGVLDGDKVATIVPALLK